MTDNDLTPPEGVEVEHKPHYCYPDWPGRTEIYFEQGYASLENMHDGAHLFVYLGSGNNTSVACLELEEAEFFYAHLGLAIEEQRQLVQKERELDEVLHARD